MVEKIRKRQSRQRGGCNLPVHFVQLRIDVLDSVLEARNDDVLDSVNTSVGCSDDFIENRESGLLIHQSAKQPQRQSHRAYLKRSKLY
jgi:hypothetical protein